MLRAILIDDEPESLQLISSLVKKSSVEVEIIGQFTDPEEGLMAIQKLSPDLLLLDIRMPAWRALNCCARLPNIDFSIVLSPLTTNTL